MVTLPDVAEIQCHGLGSICLLPPIIFEPRLAVRLECQSITPPLRCHWGYPHCRDRAVAQPQTKASWSFISVSEYIGDKFDNHDKCDSWGWKWTQGEPKTWKLAFDFPKQPWIRVVAPEISIEMLKRHRRVVKRSYNCPWVGDFEDGWTWIRA